MTPPRTTTTSHIGSGNSKGRNIHWVSLETLQAILTAVSDEIVLRSLRRRLWQACSENNITKAVQLYQMTRLQWQHLLLEEALLVLSTTTTTTTTTNEQQLQQHSAAASSTSTSTNRRGLVGRIWKNKRASNHQHQDANTSTAAAAAAAAAAAGLVPTNLPLPAAVVANNDSTDSTSSQQQAAATTPTPNTGNTYTNYSNIGILQQSMNPSEPFLVDDYYHPQQDPFQDDYMDENECIPVIQRSMSTTATERRQQQQRQGNGRFFRRFSLRRRQQRQQQQQDEDESSPASTTATSPKTTTTIWEHEDRTTPLHEAARLGSGTLVRLMLYRHGSNTDTDNDTATTTGQQQQQRNDLTAAAAAAAVDPMTRNGAQQTALHMVAGGSRYDCSCTSLEEEEDKMHNENSTKKKRSPEVLCMPPPKSVLLAALLQRSSNSKKSKRLLGRIRRLSLSSSASTRNTSESRAAPTTATSQASTIVTTAATATTTTTLQQQHQHSEDDEDRMDAILALLSWSPPQQQQSQVWASNEDNNSDDENDATTTTTTGISTNSVDDHGRTALHYAAALGRSALCQTILDYYNNYGTTLLTVVDDIGRTPCEWAAAAGHKALAAYLEARAVLYRDPFGADETMLAGFRETDGFSRSSLKTPFSWFETIWNVHEEREIRLEQCLKGIQVLLREQRHKLMLDSIEKDKKKKDEILKREHDDFSSSSSKGDNDIEQHIRSKADKGSEWPFEEDSDGSLQPDDPKVRRQMEIISRLVDGQLHMTHIEIFLSYFKWDIYEIFDSFFNKPWRESFKEAGISFPLMDDKNVSKPHFAEQKQLCLICCEEFDVKSTQWVKLTSCNHSFCSGCLGDYLANLAKSRSTGLCIFCPHHNCKAPLSPSEISDLVRTREDYQALSRTADENFVFHAHDVRYCPHPGCDGTVKFLVPRYTQRYVVQKGLHPDMFQIAGAVCAATGEHGDDVPLTCEGVGDPKYYQADSLVQPKTAHRFCFVCGEKEVHWPITCQKLAEWNDLVQERIGQVDEGQGEKYADLAQKLWMKTNTRPCPKCNAPIQKNEGCNHMTCGRCSHEFCWICRNDWRLHNSRTGGFFRCNRWVDQKEHDFYDPDHPDPATATEPTNEDLMDPSTMAYTYGTAMHETFVATLRSREMSRFLHHYRRWGAHKESADLERQMKDSVCKRLTPVVQAAAAFSNDPNLFGGRGISFVHGAFFELLECRSMLQHSYAFSYLRYQNINKQNYNLRRRLVAERMVVEERQGELEMITEQISDVVARSHLRATQSQIQFLTAAAVEKRKDFTDLMVSILVEQAIEAGAARKDRRHMPKRLVKDISSAIRTVTRNRSSTVGRHHPYQDVVSSSGYSDNNNNNNNREQEDRQIEAAIRASLVDQEREQQQTTNVAASETTSSSDDEDVRTDHIHLGWVCPVCTYRSTGAPGITAGECVMCGTPRGPLRERHVMDDYYEIIECEEDEGRSM